MSDSTPNLSLFKYNLSTDLQNPFDIQSALNNNWDTLDSHVGWKSSSTAAVGGQYQPVYVTSSGQFSTIPYNLPSQSPISATTSLSENGYIKFSNSVLINWGRALVTGKSQVINYYTSTYGYAYTSKNTYTISVAGYWWNNDTGGSTTYPAIICGTDGSLLTATSFKLSIPSGCKGIYYQTFGY